MRYIDRLWPFKNRKKFIMGLTFDPVRSVFEWRDMTVIVLQSGDAYQVKGDWRTNDYTFHLCNRGSQ